MKRNDLLFIQENDVVGHQDSVNGVIEEVRYGHHSLKVIT